MWTTFLQPTSLAETLDLMGEYGTNARLIAGGTDVLVELQRAVKPTQTLIDLSALPDLQYVRQDGQFLAIGALATHNTVLRSPLSWQYALPLAQACQEVGAPQIRTRATVAGNLLTASPANDTIPPLLALDAELVLASSAGERVLPLSQFYRGVRRTELQPGELLREIRVPLRAGERRELFLKLGLRRAQAISVVNVALVLFFEDGLVSEARIALGCVAPTVVYASHVEAALVGKRLEPEICRQAAQLVARDCAPIDDVRASASYRLLTLTNLIAYGLTRLASASESAHAYPVLLQTDTPGRSEMRAPLSTLADDSIQTTINGQTANFTHARQKTLLNFLRENAGLTGCKEGCAEGECGACTVWLNGQAVMSCLVPAAQAHGGNVTTIEFRYPQSKQEEHSAHSAAALAPAEASQVDADSPRVSAASAIPSDKQSAADLLASSDARSAARPAVGEGRYLQPLQQAFIDCGAVQCGFCIPGMLMAGAKLLEECPHPEIEQMRTALSGNICRCTGYRKILDALAQVAREQA
jgi:xanthine dehydrogenase iron-sulfur cluster and FAD-binding subunit A